jgi:hypothetical protein
VLRPVPKIPVLAPAGAAVALADGDAEEEVAEEERTLTVERWVVDVTVTTVVGAAVEVEEVVDEEEDEEGRAEELLLLLLLLAMLLLLLAEDEDEDERTAELDEMGELDVTTAVEIEVEEVVLDVTTPAEADHQLGPHSLPYQLTARSHGRRGRLQSMHRLDGCIDNRRKRRRR